MKALSLWQPWASLMAAGYKRIETRDWAPFGLQRGQLVAIHAAKRWTPEMQGICVSEPYLWALLQAQKRGLWSFEQPPLGCVVAIARFEASYPTRDGFDYEQMSDEEYAFGNFSHGRFGWVFSEVRPIQPIPTRGMQRLFEWSVDTHALHYLEETNRANLVQLRTMNCM